MGGTLKFNVDGVVRGSPGDEGIGDLLRDNTGRVKSPLLQVQSESSNAAKWVNDPKNAPWQMRKWVLNIEGLRRQINEWQVVHILSETNKDADNLAKAGVCRSDDLLSVFA
ncbi:Uncharacterized protein TCM_029377 [Theobroma cacao]|uniref:RNase H type-1 domain-containing protein n=1 Tax=Theobroma cacao TaxID=3641 RepID=A0A061GD90_THECC|nr:Uncharacterized protein TCM_029377 [Theobroma cacao]